MRLPSARVDGAVADAVEKDGGTLVPAAGPDGAVADAGESADSTLFPAPGLYYLPDGGIATTLELTSDGTFRWRSHGCDHSHGEIGRWIAEDGHMVLLPRTGDRFDWPVGSSFVLHVRVVLRRNAALDRLDAELHRLETGTRNYEPGQDKQSWFLGGRCPKCDFRPPGEPSAYSCEDPFVNF